MLAISSLAGALTTLALNLSPNPFALVEMLFWLLGSLTDRSLIHVWLAAPLIILGGALLLTTGRALDALTLGEDAAQNLGVDLSSLRNRIVAGTALSVGAATAVDRHHRLRRPRRAARFCVRSSGIGRSVCCLRAHSAAPRSFSRPTSRYASLRP